MKLNLLLFPCFTVFICPAINAKAQLISTIAGTGTAAFGGDSGPATLATLNNPFGIAVDNSGAVYFADRHNNRVRKISPSGNISTIAGDGTAGYNGDGIAGRVAGLNDPNGVAADDSGNVYIADRLNNRVRKINAAGIITTIAGNGTFGFSGDNVAATATELSNPRGVAVDKHGNVYIADQGNNRIRKVDPAGIITTIAGTGTAGYNGDGIGATTAELFNPYGVAVDTSGNIFVADVDNQRIRKIDVAGSIATIAGTGSSGFSGDGGPAGAARLSEPIAVAADNFGNIFIADDYNGRIREINASGAINTIAGTGTNGYNGDGIFATAAQLNNPTGVAVSSNSAVYIADYNNNRIRYMPQPTIVGTFLISSHVSITPNPNQGTFQLYIPTNTTEHLLIRITDVLGRQINEITASTNDQITMRIDCPPGTYFLEAATISGKWQDKIVVVN